jgi:hypothetical protein
LFVVERETLSAEQQRDYLALLSSRGGELRERYQIRKEGVRTPTVAHLSSPALRSSRRDYVVPPLPGAFFLNGGKLLEEVAYVTNAYVPLQLLYCKRVERETLCRHQQRDSPAWRLLFSGWKAYIEDGIIRNECVRNPTVALPFYLGERGWQTSTYCRVITLAREGLRAL